MTLPLARSELKTRRPVWFALSQLYLDTELDEAALNAIAEELVSSPYSIDELARIRRLEVAPILRWNAWGPAGEWAGFDRAWLTRAIVHRLARPRWSRVPIWGGDIGLSAWRVLVPKIQRIRSAPEQMQSDRR